jgi:hypothetical protein
VQREHSHFALSRLERTQRLGHGVYDAHIAAQTPQRRLHRGSGRETDLAFAADSALQ